MAAPAAGGAATTQRRFFSIDVAPDYLRETSLYERKAVTDLWNKLTVVAKQQWKWKNVPNKESREWIKSRKRILQVRGPPGSGKSSAVFYWVVKTCEASSSIQSFWIDCSTNYGKCWKLELDEGTRVVKATQADFPTTDATCMIVVFDGVRASTLDTWVGLMNDLARLGLAVILVSSEGVTFHSGHSQDISKLDHFVPSWVESEYTEAILDDNFWRDVHPTIQDASQEDNVSRRKKLLDAKFVTAGHSARFMFKYPEDEVLKEISEKAKTVKLESLDDAVKADRSTGALNTLIARLDDGGNGITPHEEAVFPVADDTTAVATSISDLIRVDGEWQHSQSYPRLVSAFASERVAKALPSEVERLRSIGRSLDNNEITGYALEAQLKKKLYEATNPGQNLDLRSGGQRTSLNVSKVITCENPIEVENALRVPQPGNTWIFIAGLQGAFDAVHIVSPTHIRFVQVTAGKSHSFKLGIIDSLLQRLAQLGVTWSHLEYLFLRPEDDLRPFRLDTARGGLQNYLRFDNIHWDRKDARSNAQYATLGWE